MPRHTDIPTLTFAVKTAAGVDDEKMASKFNSLHDTVTKLTATVTALTDRHKHLEAAMSAPTPQPPHQPFTRRFTAPRMQNSAPDGFHPMHVKIQDYGTTKPVAAL